MEKVIYLTNGSAALSESYQQVESLKGAGKSKNLRAHHTAMQPIRSKEDFDKFCTYFLSNHNYRDYALFIVGIELGTLRGCDLLKLKIKDVYDGKEFRDTVYGVVEQKTGKIKNVYIPEYPVGTAEELADKIAEFLPIARAVLGVKNLKIITFGPRPQDFFACNAPIKGLYELGVEIEENSELDLLVSYKEHAGDPRIADVCKDMAAEMGEGHYYPDLLTRMAQFELTLLDWAENHKGSKKYVAFADKCWPAFPSQFGFEPCYVNSRLASRGIPVACEVDIYGALSEYIGMCASGDTVTLLDINNSVPKYIYDEDITGKFNYKLTDTFMGFHCGNTPSCKMCSDRAVKYQLIQHRLLEPAGSDPDFTRGTLEGDIAPSDITFYRLQCDSEGQLRAYIAQGEILPVATRSFGGIAIFAIPEMGRFYRHVLIQKRYPHHGAVAFGHYGKTLFEVFKFLGIADIAYNQPKSLPYPTENPFA